MRTVTHREMRNNSAEVLRAVAAGETIQVTNNGVVAAVLSPPHTQGLDDLVARGQARAATRSLIEVLALKRPRSRRSTSEILADSRGSW